MDNLKKVLIAAPVHRILTESLQAQGYECVFSEKITQSVAFDLIGDCVGVVTSTRLQLNRELIDAAPALQWIGRMGSGMEVVDVAYATERGIACFASPEGNCDAVGEHAIGMLLNLIRRITWSHNELAHGIWKRDENRGYELAGRTVGVIGYGHTGAAFARKLAGFDVSLIAYDKNNLADIPTHIHRCDSLEELMNEAEIVSFHVPLQDDTIHYFGADFIKDMRKPFILINTSRGRVVDLNALYAGLASGKVTGACLDVFETEPLPAADEAMKVQLHEMLLLPNVIVTPHIAGYTYEALYKMSKVLADKISAMHSRSAK